MGVSFLRLFAILKLDHKPMKKIDWKKFGRNIEAIYTLDEFKEKIKEGRPLRIKYGVDATAPFLHLGHAVNLWKMRELQNLGHKVILLIGDFTTTIGDPTGRTKTRPSISKREILANVRKFIKQAKIILRSGPRVFKVEFNSGWFKKMTVPEFMKLLTMVTHGRLIERDMFQKRLRGKNDIYLHELLYPILQGLLLEQINCLMK